MINFSLVFILGFILSILIAIGSIIYDYFHQDKDISEKQINEVLINELEKEIKDE